MHSLIVPLFHSRSLILRIIFFVPFGNCLSHYRNYYFYFFINAKKPNGKISEKFSGKKTTKKKKKKQNNQISAVQSFIGKSEWVLGRKFCSKAMQIDSFLVEKRQTPNNPWMELNIKFSSIVKTCLFSTRKKQEKSIFLLVQSTEIYNERNEKQITASRKRAMFPFRPTRH